MKRKVVPLSVVPLTTDRVISSVPEMEEILFRQKAPVAIGVSGGKDSSAVAIATTWHLRNQGHEGPIILVHADLGMVEWQDSLPTCRRLSDFLEVPLYTVARPKGGMMERWEQRWSDNCRRWNDLSCVKVILPWSTPSMRFCTAETKVDQITKFLKRHWPTGPIVNVTGIRAAESTERAKAPITGDNPKLARPKVNASGYDWHPILSWSTPDVYEYAKQVKFPLHEAYEKFGSSRVSCVACILATENDHKAATRDTRNHEVIRRMADLELRSAFSFQGNRWLTETAMDIMPAGWVFRLAEAKRLAEKREEIESALRKDLLFVKGWPTSVPSAGDASMIASVRDSIAKLLPDDLRNTFNTVKKVRDRYRELIELKSLRA